MSSIEILTIILVTSTFSLIIEKQVSWITYFSSVCFVVLGAILLGFFGFIPTQHQVYDFFIGPTLPIAIALMILGLDISCLKSVPTSLLKVYIVGALGSAIGGIVASLVVYQITGDIVSLSLGAELSASYIGGGENAVSMKEILNIPNEEFIVIFTVDNLLTSLWMIITMMFSTTLQTSSSTEDTVRPFTYDRMIEKIMVTLATAFGVCLISSKIATYVGLHPILIITIIGTIIAQVSFLRSYLDPSYILGSIVFYPFFFSMGAISDISTLSSLPTAYLIMPVIVVACHGLTLFIYYKMTKANASEIALASQALIGGVGTAVAIAQAKRWKNLVTYGVFIGILGYAIGNYVGLAVFHITKLMVGI